MEREMDDRGVKMGDVARACGVAVSTVSRALAGHPGIPEATRERVRAMAQSMAYRPNPMVGALMTQVRRRSVASGANLACLYGGDERSGMARMRRAFVRGLEREAAAMGYEVSVGEWDREGVTAAGLASEWRAKNVRGVIMYGVRHEGRDFEMPWDDFCWVVCSHVVVGPKFHRVGNEIYGLLKMALRGAAERGYRRPGLAVPLAGPRREGFRWAGAFYGNALHYLGGGDWERMLFRGEWERGALLEWVGRERPDVVFGLTDEALGWLESAGLQVPGDLGFLHLAANESERGAAGIGQDSEGVGAASVSVVDGLLRRDERGVPEVAGVTTIGGRWVEGGSL